ncbi:MAG: GNAT family N-acetyltransferase [Alphaproteobacteria bacterium]
MRIDVEEMGERDRPDWADMRMALWPDIGRKDHLVDIDRMLASERHFGYRAATVDGAAVGFAEISIRDYANGCTAQPVPFLEGIWVHPESRRRRVGAALVSHIVKRLVAQGYAELCSDADLENGPSHRAHAAWGFTETERVICFRKHLGGDS